MRWWCIPPALPRPPGCLRCLPIRPWPWLTWPRSFLVFFLLIFDYKHREINGILLNFIFISKLPNTCLVVRTSRHENTSHYATQKRRTVKIQHNYFWFIWCFHSISLPLGTFLNYNGCFLRSCKKRIWAAVFISLEFLTFVATRVKNNIHSPSLIFTKERSERSWPQTQDVIKLRRAVFSLHRVTFYSQAIVHNSR